MNTINARFWLRKTETVGEIPTIPASNNHLDGTWISTDIYDGEMFVNTIDERVWVRCGASIIEFGQEDFTQIQSDWTEENELLASYIQNKPEALESKWEADGTDYIKPVDDKSVLFNKISGYYSVNATFSAQAKFSSNTINAFSYSPLTGVTGSFTNSLVNAKEGFTCVIYHNDSTVPSFPANWFKISFQEYRVNQINIVKATYINDDRIEYEIMGEPNINNVIDTRLIPLSSTSPVITFSKNTIYFTWDSPSTAAEFVATYGTAKAGVIQKIYHTAATEPTFPASWVRLGGGDYVENELNVIFAEWVSGTRVEYWINH